MSKAKKDRPIPHVEVSDAAAAFRKLEDAARRIMAAPKNGTDAKGKGKAGKSDKRR